MTPEQPSSEQQPPHGHTYTIGTLTYNRKTVAILFGWLLWGDFAFTFFEQIFGKFMPLYLKDLNASNTLIGITTGSIAGLVNVFFLPNISQWCDRLRTRLGRRIPFLLVVTPLTIFSLLGVGFAPEISAWLHKYITSPIAPWLSASTLLLSLLCVLAISFHFFNMVLVNAYNWLLRDVVPQMFMARFLSWFRIVGTVASVLFLWFVFPTMISHREITFIGVGVFYFLAFMLMCWQVKEGKYPEPEPQVGHNIFTRYGAYFRDCLALPIYRNFFLTNVLFIIATWSAGSFITLFSRNTLGLHMSDIGHIFAYSALASAIIYAPMGWFCDKFSSLWVVIVSLAIQIVVAVGAYFFVDDKTTWLIYSLVIAIPNVGWGLGSLALTMYIFPDKVFGQFSSGMNVFGCGGVILGNYLIGVFMDLNNSNYKLVFLWSAFFYAAAIIPMYLVYRDWLKYGGPKNYVPPLPDHLQHLK